MLGYAYGTLREHFCLMPFALPQPESPKSDKIQKMLKEGLKPAQALRQAQIEMFNSDEDYSNPDFWATFTLQGEWR